MKKLYPLLSVLFLISVCISQDKVNVNNLVKHEDKHFKENEYIPYDGIVFDMSKETGNRTLKFRMINGIKNGSYEEWYSNGKPKTIGEYLNDDSTNSWTMWYENGQKESEKNYKNGKKYGLWIKWYENGMKGGKETYKNNNRDGLFYRWYENGQKEIKGTYKDGKKDGSWIKWYENGQKEIESYFQDGEERGLITEWYENGLRREERTFKQVLTYTENGLKRERKTYKKKFTYYDTGNIKREKNYRDEKEWGLEILYHDNGKIKYKDVVYKKNGEDNTNLIFTGYDKYGKLIEGDETWWDGFEIKSGECYKDNEEVDCYVPN
tara:strand:+ start:2132 stop:3097 length:966 start_codon:yes stop_codon:yes gene_type:complete